MWIAMAHRGPIYNGWPGDPSLNVWSLYSLDYVQTIIVKPVYNGHLYYKIYYLWLIQ